MQLRKSLIAAAAATFCLGSAIPAQAHYTSIYHGSDNAWVYNGHVKLGVQDNECDGNGVYVEYYLASGLVRHSKSDANGCAQGATTYSTGDTPIAQYRVCEAGVGCSLWATV